MRVELSRKQAAAIAFARSPGRRYFSAVGAVRSGKTVACAGGHAVNILQARTPDEHAVFGFSVRSAIRNVVRPHLGLLWWMKALGGQAELKDSKGYIEIKRGRGRASRVWLVGANNLRAADSIAGATLASSTLDEVVRYPEDVFDMIWTRHSLERSKIWGTANPGATRHWYRKKVLDRLAAMRAVHLTYVMKDNPGLTPEQRRDIEAGVVGVQRRRLIGGEWVDLSGLIYPPMRQVNMPQTPVVGWSIALDWASSGILAALLFAHGDDFDTIVSEHYHDARTQGVLNDTEHALAVAGWARTHSREGLGEIPVIGDPSTSAGFQRDLEAQGFRWTDADNAVDAGIKATARAIALGKVRLAAGACPKFEDEMAGYVWDPKAMERGEDKPLKQDDHGPDALRYRVHTEIAPMVVRAGMVGF